METTYAKAPWLIRYGSGIDYKIISEIDGTIVKGDFPTTDMQTMDENENQWFANAKLIASAPELLEALEGMVEFFRGINEDLLTENDHEIHRKAFKAIAKAKGHEN